MFFKFSVFVFMVKQGVLSIWHDYSFISKNTLLLQSVCAWLRLLGCYALSLKRDTCKHELPFSLYPTTFAEQKNWFSHHGDIATKKPPFRVDFSWLRLVGILRNLNDYQFDSSPCLTAV